MSQKNFEQMFISSEPPMHHRILQNFLLVWLDPKIDEINNEDYRLSIAELRRTVKTIHTFTNADQCIDFLTDITNAQVFMIVSSAVGKHIISLVHDVPQLDSVYIFCKNELTNQHWIENWSKIKGIFTQITSVGKVLSQAAQQCDQNMISVSIIPPTDDVLSQHFDELDQSFMYSQILKEILLEIKYDEQSIKDFAAYCRNQCFSSHMDLKSVDEFEKDYHHQSSIWWYTSPTFIYSMLNRALRTQELDTIIKMGFFICDLHRHIEQLHTDEFKNRLFEPYTVYRGQGICKTDFDKMIRSKGGLMSFNNFLSTSTDQIISLTFAHSNATHSGMIGIFFEITIEPTVSSVHFAHLDNISYYKDLEQEILFSMHTVFRIGEINQIDKSNDQLWHVKLTLTNDNDQQLKALTEYMRKNITGYNGWNRLTQLLILLGEYDKAEQIIQILFDSTCNDSQKGTLYNQLGAIKRGQGDFMKALSFYQDFLKSAEQIRPVCDHNIGVACSAIGELYGKMGTYSEALYFHEKALVIQEKILDSNDPTLATSYSNIAITFENTAEYAKAILYQEKALRIKEKILPQNHPDLAISYNIMGILYESLGKYAEALPLYQKVLVIREKSLPPQHPSILVSCENIAKSYSRLQQYTQAIFYLEKAQEICHKIYPPNHPDFCHVYVLSGSIYDDMNQSSKALSYYEKVLEIHEKTPPLNQVELAEFYNNIGLVYAKTRKYSKALLFHDKALEIRHKTLPANHPDFGQSYNNIGSTYSSMGEYSKALSNFQKSLEIKQKTLPPNHPSIKITCSNITSLYNMITKK